MLSHRRIGTFRIARIQDAVLVHDMDPDNNWGQKYFANVRAAQAWARWAQSLKSERGLRDKPNLLLAA